MRNKEQYNLEMHNTGRVFLFTAIAIIAFIPIAFFIATGTTPMWDTVIAAIPFMLGYVAIGIIESISYAPLLGTGGQYLSFVTGNIANLKLPCAINSQSIAKTKQGSEEQEIVTTIAIATSSIVTTLIIVIGLIPLSLYNEEIIQLFAPVSPYVLPAIFGGLTVVLFAKFLKLTLVPFLIMLILSIITFALGFDLGQSTMIPIGMVISVAFAFILYKKKKI